jgi:hypothetical protein
METLVVVAILFVCSVGLLLMGVRFLKPYEVSTVGARKLRVSGMIIGALAAVIVLFMVIIANDKEPGSILSGFTWLFGVIITLAMLVWWAAFVGVLRRRSEDEENDEAY